MRKNFFLPHIFQHISRYIIISLIYEFNFAPTGTTAMAPASLPASAALSLPLLLLLCSVLPTSNAIFEDQIGKYDW